jgi:hypothetical protein
MRGGPVADRRLDPAALHPTATFVDGWLQARPRDWLAQVGTAALDPRRGYASALVAPLGHATVVGDHVHAIRLANAVTDQARRQVKQVTLGHRGRTYDPPYLIRKLLVTAAEQLTQRGRARLRARDTMKIERGADRSANLDSTRWPLSWGSVTVPNHVASGPQLTGHVQVSEPSKFSAGYHRRDWCRDRRPLGATPDMKGMERCHRRCT